MVQIVAFFGTCCDLMTAGWLELYGQGQTSTDPKVPVRVEILRSLCTREVKRLADILAGRDPETSTSTPDYPRGKLNEEDEGAISIAFTVEQDCVVIRFPKPITWLGLPAELADAMGQRLLERAEEAKKNRQ